MDNFLWQGTVRIILPLGCKFFSGFDSPDVWFKVLVHFRSEQTDTKQS